MKIIVIGDTILDINHYCITERMAPEANIPIYKVIKTEFILGGAANVANNINMVDSNLIYVSVIGNDYYSTIITKKLKFNYKLITDTRITTQKNRLIYNDTIINRYDIEETTEISNDLSDEILQYIKSIEDINIVVISDYAKGLITNYLCTNLIKYCNENNIFTIVDPKVSDFLKYKDCFCIKPNLIEGQIMSGYSTPADIVLQLQEKLNCNNVIISCGSDGLYFNLTHMHTEQVKLIDVTGAGDTLISILTYLFNKTTDLYFSAKYANYIASKSIEVIGNYLINKNDITNYITKIIYDNETDKIKLLSLFDNIVFTNGCFDIIHVAHIKLLKYAKSLGKILVVGLNSDSSIKYLKGNQRPINNITERCELLQELDFIDYIIIFNDQTPINIIKLLRPDILVKGGDYTINTVIGKEYVKEVILFDKIENKSTTYIINKIKKENTIN